MRSEDDGDHRSPNPLRIFDVFKVTGWRSPVRHCIFGLFKKVRAGGSRRGALQVVPVEGRNQTRLGVFGLVKTVKGGRSTTRHRIFGLVKKV